MTETISREDRAWLAAMIEGEGSLFFATHHLKNEKPTVRPSISVTNNDMRIIKRVSEIWYKLGAKFYYYLKKIHGTTKHRAMSINSCGRKSVLKILDAIEEFMSAKTEQVQLFREYINWMENEMSNRKQENGRYRRLTTEEKAQYRDVQQEFKKRLSDMRTPSIDPQRLTRKASKPLQF